MLNLKKTAVAVLALGSSAVFAGTMGPVCTPGSVTVPCESTAWDFGVQALYLQTTGGIANDLYNFSELAGSVRTYNDFNSDWDWGFKLEGSYHFSTGNDLTVNWYHLDRDHSYNFPIFTDVIAGRDVNGFTVNPEWDAVNVEFGQHVDFGEFKKIRFHGGVQYSRLENNLNTYNSAVNPSAVTSITSKFNGFGPRVGADMSYQLGNGFAMYANGATTLLIGQSKLNSSFPITNNLTGVNATRDAMVPELEAKLGLTYTYAMAQGNLSLDAGYMWVDYINVHQHALVNTLGQTFANNSNNFGLDGVYFGLKYVGNV